MSSISGVGGDSAWASATLRPPLEAMLRAWEVLVREEAAQVERLPNRPRPEDFYAPVAPRFRGDPTATDDPVLPLLLSLIEPGETVLDLGAGGGRYSLPLAAHSREVYAVEPSAGMLSVLRAAAAEHGVSNVRIFQERWPGPSAAPVADVALIAHVGYDITEIGPFLDQMEAHARRLCIAVLFRESPIAMFAPLWSDVYGEKRLTLPALPELVALLFARGRAPSLQGLELPPRTFESVEALHEACRRPLWVLEGSEEDQRLKEAVRRRAVEVGTGVSLDPRPRYLGVVSWQPR